MLTESCFIVLFRCTVNPGMSLINRRNNTSKTGPETYRYTYIYMCIFICIYINYFKVCYNYIKSLCRARHIPLPDGLGQVKLSVRQVDLDKFSSKSYMIWYWKKSNFESRASEYFEKRRALLWILLVKFLISWYFDSGNAAWLLGHRKYDVLYATPYCYNMVKYNISSNLLYEITQSQNLNVCHLF